MALLIPAGLAVFGAYSLVNKMDESAAAQAQTSAMLARRFPTSGRYQSHAATGQINYKQPVEVIPDIDVHGVPRYLVDYGSGSKTVQYTRPQYWAGAHTQY